MKLVLYGPDRTLGVQDGDQVIDINGAYAKYLREARNEPLPYAMAGAIVPGNLDDFIVAGQRAIEGAQQALDHLARRASDQLGPRGERLVEPLASVKIHAPYARRARIIMAGSNFLVHAQGMAYRSESSDKPDMEAVLADRRKNGIWGFYCFPENAVGPDEEVIYPARTDRLDYEGEVAIILGKAGKDIDPADGASYVWGYMLQNDISARTNLLGRDNPQSSFARNKNFDTSVCGGPCIVVGEIADCHNVDFETRVNGELRQRGNTRDMIFNYFEYMAYMSSDMTLRPGDVISCGTTGGTAQDSSEFMEGERQANENTAKRRPEKFLKPGDVVEVSSPQIGVLRNRVVAKPPKA